MPQVFGTDQIDLMNRVSMWTEAANLQGDPSSLSTLHNFMNDEGFSMDKERPPNAEQQALAAGRTTFTRYLGHKTVGNKPSRTDSNGQLLNGDGYHEFVIHMNPLVPEGQKETQSAGPRRYELSYHHVDKNDRLHPQSIWTGNSLLGLNRKYEGVKDLIGRVR